MNDTTHQRKADALLNAHVIRGYETGTQTLLSRKLIQGGYTDEVGKIFLDGTLITLDHAAHRKLRQVENALLKPSTMAMLERTVLAPAIDRAIDDARSGSRGADLLRIVRRSVLPVTAVLIGLGDVTAHLDEFENDDLLNRGEAAAINGTGEGWRDVVDAGLAAQDRIRSRLFEPAWERHISGPLPTDAQDQTLISILATHTSLDRAEVFREVVLYLIASTETTAYSTASTAAELLLWSADDPGRRLRCESEQFLRAAAFEALRLHPALEMIPRLATEPFTLEDGTLVDEGDYVFIDTVHANRDTAVFGPDANEFNPDRTVPRRVRPYGLSFGTGSHLCIGRNAAVGDNAEEDAATTTGIMVKVLDACFRAGMSIDPENPPAVVPDEQHRRFSSFPVKFAH